MGNNSFTNITVLGASALALAKICYDRDELFEGTRNAGAADGCEAEQKRYMGFHFTTRRRPPEYRRGALLWLLAGLLAGCAPPPPDDLASLDLTAAYAIAPDDTGQGNRPVEFGFTDEVLAELVIAALEGNPDLAAARARLGAADAELRASGARVTGNADVSIRLNDPGADSADVGLGARLDPARAARQAGALARADAARFDAEDARRLLLQEVVTTYIDLRYFQQLLEFRRADVASRSQTLNELQVLFDAGAVTEFDVVSARALLIEARGQIPGTEVDALREKTRLSALIGRPVSDLGVNLAFAGEQPQPQDVLDQGVPADLLRFRSDIRRAERLYAAALADVSVAQAALYPSLSLSGQVQVPLDGGDVSTGLVPGLSIPVLGRPALRAGVDAAEAGAAAAFQQWRGTVLTAGQELESALAARVAADRAVAASTDVLALQRKALTLSRRLLVAGGDITALDILDREEALSAARATLALDRREMALAHIGLLSALGLNHAATTKIGS